jgi:hypothetical protein
MNPKTTITGIIGVLFNVIAAFGFEVEPKLQMTITSILVALALYFAADANNQPVATTVNVDGDDTNVEV